MKQIILFSLAVFFTACSGGSSKIPSAPKNLDDAKKLISGKSWQLADLGLMRVSMLKKENNELPEISWLSGAKDMDDFSKKSLDKHQGTKFDVKNDGTLQAFLEDYVMYGKQTYDLADEEGTVFKVRADSAQSSAFGMMKGMTITYKILGIDENKMLLQTESEINGNKVIYLLENKK